MNRNTQQREAILKVFDGVGIHLTPAEVMEEIQRVDARVSQATVYRNLNYLCECGKIRKISRDGFVCYDGNMEPHDHAVCRGCGKIIDVPALGDLCMDERAAEASGMKILTHSILYEGLCDDCAAVIDSN